MEVIFSSGNLPDGYDLDVIAGSVRALAERFIALQVDAFVAARGGDVEALATASEALRDFGLALSKGEALSIMSAMVEMLLNLYHETHDGKELEANERPGDVPA